MATIRLYTDEDIAVELAEQLRHHGYDALSCRDADNHNRGMSDAMQLRFAVEDGRTIVTRNAADFIQLDAQWKIDGQEHSGIICIPGNPSIAEMVLRLRNHLNVVSPERQFNTLLWA